MKYCSNCRSVAVEWMGQTEEEQLCLGILSMQCKSFQELMDKTCSMQICYFLYTWKDLNSILLECKPVLKMMETLDEISSSNTKLRKTWNNPLFFHKDKWILDMQVDVKTSIYSGA